MLLISESNLAFQQVRVGMEYDTMDPQYIVIYASCPDYQMGDVHIRIDTKYIPMTIHRLLFPTKKSKSNYIDHTLSSRNPFVSTKAIASGAM